MKNIGFKPERKNSKGVFERLDDFDNEAMFKENDFNKKSKRKLIINIILLIIALLLIVFLVFITFNKNSQNGKAQIFLEGIDVTDKNLQDIKYDLEKDYLFREKKPVDFKIDNLSIKIFAKDFDFKFDIDKTLEKIQKAQDALKDNTLKDKLNIDLVTEYNQQKFYDIYKMILSKINLNRGIKVNLDVSKLKVEIIKNKPLISIDKNEFYNQIVNKYKSNEFYTVSNVKTIEKLDSKNNFENIYNSIKRKPINAYLNNDNKIVDAVEGIDFVLSYEKAFEKYQKNDKVDFKLKKIEAKIKKEDLLKQQKDLKERERINSAFLVNLFEKKYNLKNLTYQEKYNAKIASKNLNGFILMPNNEFSFNSTIDTISTEKGYVKALSQNKNGLNIEVGGGVSIISSIIYEALLNSGLKTIERTPYIFTPRFTNSGLEARVEKNSYDLKMINTLKDPIRFEFIFNDDLSEVKIIIEGSEKDKKNIEIKRIVSNEKDYNTEELENSLLEKGLKRVLQKGRVGNSTEIQRIYKKDGEISNREKLTKDRYQPLNELVEIGTNDQIINLE